jgi:formylglycine-generating enzyme
VTLAGSLALWSCGTGGPIAPPPAPPPTATAPEKPPVGLATLTAAPEQDAGSAPAGPAPMCPEGMVYVDTTHCTNARSRCLKDEYNKANHITICYKFAPGQECLSEPRRQRFCIDKYEYPNVAGGHPPVMVDWYDGMAACKERGKRLCWESEWVSACEGPEKLPFPYGLARDPKQCNIDNPWLIPELDKIYSTNPEIAGAELLHLDQSAPSGSRPGCVSGFGVHDLTGNFDEWVMSEEQRDEAKWAGLKGGAWGHVRNACRPKTMSHPPEFTYYFISFRCCADAGPLPEGDTGPKVWSPPPLPEKTKRGKISAGWTPTK